MARPGTADRPVLPLWFHRFIVAVALIGATVALTSGRPITGCVLLVLAVVWWWAGRTGAWEPTDSEDES